MTNYNSEDWKTDGDPDELWTLIDLARRDYPRFIDALRSADRKMLIRFHWWFEWFASALLESPFIDYAGEDRSEDALEDLTGEVVGKGKAFYEAVCADPERMPVEIDPRDVAHQLRYQASRVFSERYGEPIPPYGWDYQEASPG